MNVKTFLIYFIFFVFYSCNYSNNNFFNKSYKGVVKKKYEELMNHNMWVFEVESENFKFKEGAEHFPKSWEYAEIGDSIIKKKGCPYITIKKHNGDSANFFYK
jgi:hypothetical protein